MKTKRFKQERLRNEEWFQFFTEFKTLVENRTAKSIDIEALFAVFVNLYADAYQALEIIRKSAITTDLVEADVTRDSILKGLAYAVRSAQNHFDANKRAAAARLMIVVEQYGNIARKPYDEETASITNFLQDMRANGADISLLALNDWLSQLEVENTRFAELMRDRYDETSGKSTLRMKEVRVQLDQNYQDTLDRLDALMLIKGGAAYETFIKDLNVRVDRFSNLLAQRSGRSGKADSSTSETKNPV